MGELAGGVVVLSFSSTVGVLSGFQFSEFRVLARLGQMFWTLTIQVSRPSRFLAPATAVCPFKPAGRRPFSRTNKGSAPGRDFVGPRPWPKQCRQRNTDLISRCRMGVWFFEFDVG